MLNVKLTTCAPDWPWARQTPLNSLTWEDITFHVDTDIAQCDAWVVFESLAARQQTLCPPDCTLFITGEPNSVGAYPERFVKQFAQVMTSRDDLIHPNIIRR